ASEPPGRGRRRRQVPRRDPPGHAADRRRDRPLRERRRRHHRRLAESPRRRCPGGHDPRDPRRCAMNPDDGLVPRIPIGAWAESGIDWLKENLSWLFAAFTWLMEFLVGHLTDALLFLPALALIPLFALLAWAVRSWRMGVGTLVMMLVVVAMDQWTAMLQTMALVIVATVFAVLIAVPLRILAAMNSTVSAIVKPIMDFMQTMPAFVYLIPAVTFFSIGLVPGMFSTIIFALPPGVRMTELGIRQVDKETVEAGRSFRATRRPV